MRIVLSFTVGLIFGIGLLLSGMADPSKVLGFLDLAGKWDPSLALVMGGAIAVGLPAFQFAKSRDRSLLGEPMRLPAANRIDRRLIVGGLTFGIGWGMAGYCPGPALVSVLGGGEQPLIFAAAMVSGMAIFELLEWRAARSKRHG